MFDIEHQPIEAFETASISDGPPKWAGRIAVAFGLLLVLTSAVAAVTSILGLLHSPTSVTSVTAAADEDVVVEDEAPVDEVQAPVTTGRAITGSRIRSGSSQGAQTVGGIDAGDVVEITGAPLNGWYPVTHEGVSGWTFGRLLTDIHTTGGAAEAAPADDATGQEPLAVTGPTMVTRQALILRSGPSMSYPSNGTVPQGSSVTITGPLENGWFPVSYNGTPGYLHPNFLR